MSLLTWPLPPAASAALVRTVHAGLVHAGLVHAGLVHAELADVVLNPDPTSLPGGGALQQLTNGLGGWALILSLVGLLIGAASWALGSHTQNYQQSFFGRRAVLVSGLAALLIGAAPALINFFFHTGLSVH